MNGQAPVPIFTPDCSGNEAAYLLECIRTGWVSSIGPFVHRFERDFAQFCGMPFGVSLNSGTAALHLALRVLGIGPGDEVILPALTFASTANAVLYLGATPRLADCGAQDWNMDPQSVRALITPRTRAIIPVHLYGTCCDMASLLEIARPRGISLVEDCAEAHGATCGGQIAGSFGTISCFSFYGNKIITTGEGGMCLTRDEALDSRMRMLRDHGMNKARRYWHDEVGYNYRMTNLQAAVGCAQLERIDALIRRKRWMRDQYVSHLDGLGLQLPTDPPGGLSVFWLFTVLLPEAFGAQERDDLIRHLASQGIDSRPVFHPLHHMPPYREYADSTPNAERISARGITLPSGYGLTESDIERVSTALHTWLDARSK